MRNFLKILFIIILFSISCVDSSTGGKQYTIINYKKDVDFYAKKYNLPASYLLALITLESSGKKKIKPRFEKHVYTQLKALRDGKIKRFEDLTAKDLKGLSNKDLKKLAKSYGPFQIMGYKTIKMNIKVEDLEGDSAIKYGVEWINKEYGDILRAGNFKDAFHMHNTGHAFPADGKSKTHNPRYVEQGLEYMRYFSQLY